MTEKPSTLCAERDESAQDSRMESSQQTARPPSAALSPIMTRPSPPDADAVNSPAPASAVQMRLDVAKATDRAHAFTPVSFQPASGDQRAKRKIEADEFWRRLEL